jgi:SecD/SecF fusion protein
MKNHFGRFLLVFVLVALCAIAYKTKEPKLGLDLEGGSSLTYKVKVADGGELTSERVKRVIDVVDKRLNGIGVSEISIVPTQQNEIVIELPGRGAEQIKTIRSLVERNGSLEFRIQAEASEERKWRELKDAQDVKPPAEYMWVPQKDSPADMLVKTPERPILNELNKLKRRKTEELRKQAVADAAAKGLAEGSAESAAALKAYLASPEYAADISKFEETEEVKKLQRAYEEKKREEFFSGDELVKTEVHHQIGQIVVFFSFKDARKPWFGQFTEKHQGENMAIILDGRVDSAPRIKSKLPGEGIIEGGRGATGFTEVEAKALQIVLESGSTGVNLELSREESLGPSLGEVAIGRGLWSVFVGLGLVVATMIYYYRLPGIVANFALVLNLVILMGVLAFFRAALTLPGIAGIVLTLGMAVDANVLIFERFREERQRGKSLPEALAAGYDRAMSAIIDSNATTILTAIVLIVMGTGAVKGFGVTLTVGLIASMFTSVYVTRWIFDWAVEKGHVEDLKLGGVGKTPSFDYMRKRKWFTFPSSILMIGGVLLFIARDDYEKRDIEFVGGQEAIVQLAKPIDAHAAEALVKSDPRWSEASVVTLKAEGVQAGANETNRFRLRAKAATSEEGEAFLSHVRGKFADVLAPPPFAQETVEPRKEGGFKAALVVNVEGDPGDTTKWKNVLETAGFAEVDVQKDPASSRAVKLSLVDRSTNASVESVRARVGEAVQKLDPKVALSDPMPAKSFLEKSRAEELYKSALWAVIVSLLIEIVYIRIRFADYGHGLAAVVAIIHDVAITLGAVTIADYYGVVYAKVNLVLIAAFLTLIGYSMNDNMVVFDRIREMLGKRRVVNSTMINEAINLTLARSIRTSVTVFMVVLAQSIFSFGTGSTLEGFSFVMVVGVLTSMYSSIFIAAPLLLFLPLYLKKFSARPSAAALMVIATLAGVILMKDTSQSDVRLWLGAALSFNIPIHFLFHFFPWLLHEDPDSFVREQAEEEERQRPTQKPGI